jgi:hypothetical protein
VTCEEAEVALVLGGSPEVAAHRATCARCAGAGERARHLRLRLDGWQVPDLPPDRIERDITWTRAAAVQVLARRAARARGPRRRLAAALTVMAALLPLVLAANAQLVRTVHTLLSSFLPGYLTSYLVGSLAVFLLLLLALGCASVPLLAARSQLRPREEIHV